MEAIRELLKEIGLGREDAKVVIDLLSFLGEVDKFRDNQILRQFSALVLSSEANRPQLIDVMRSDLRTLNRRRSQGLLLAS